jgi:hypothetical protein
MIPKAKIVLLGGMGYPVTETPWGLPSLKERFEALGAQVLMVNWAERQEVYNFVKGWLSTLAYFGDSLGAGSAGEYPGDIKREVDFAGGFQPSRYDDRTRTDPVTDKPVQTIAPNIIRAHCIYDPHFLDTMGLGCASWKITPGSKTILLVTEHRGAHPDDWGYSQDLLFNEFKPQLEH